ncbi:MAG TPA: GAF domain-containing sensor histidine kinase [Gemmatimonadales bacterium]|nr:GAF domain-containing sensor histidine kinase [Gemmatimonadales bacterium]
MTPDQPADETRTRWERLIRAGIRISEGHSLEAVLQAVADAAREVTGGRYAALGILDASGEGLAQFVASGLTPEEHRRIGSLPRGRGVLGHLIRVPHPVRIADIARHPAAVGFPPEHPPMRSFLGVPVVGRDGPLGNLYITEKQGAAEFSDEDEALAVSLAAQTAVAVENARLFEETNRLLGELRVMQRSRDRFYAMINHELRNALTAVYGWAELLVRRKGSDTPQAAREVFESAERTLRLLNDLLDLSRLDVSKLAPVVREADAGEVLAAALQTVRPAADERGVTIALKAPTEAVPIRTDAQRVSQIVINLLSNAVRHSPEKGTVVLEAAPTDQRLMVSVADHGPGLSAEEQAVIFEAFTRGATEDSRGTGLGLALSLQLARLLGGDLRVESHPGAGARFILDIPRFLAGK